MTPLWRLTLAFLRRDVRSARVYRLALALQLFGIAAELLTYFFLSNLVEGGAGSALAAYGGDFFAYVLVGLAFWGLLSTAATGALVAVQAEQRNGTLEVLLVSHAPAPLLILGGSLLPLLLASGEVVIYLVGGAVFFNLNWSGANWPALLLLAVLAVLHGLVLGLFLAAVIIVVKRGESAGWLLMSALAMLVGIFYPVEVLPAPLQILANFIPLTHALRGIRQSLFSTAAPGELFGDVLILGVSTVLLAVIGVWTLNGALQRARSQGSLAQF